MMSDPSADVNNVIDACQNQEDERQISDVSKDPLTLTGEESDENDITANDEMKANDDNDLDEDAGGEKQTSDISRPQNAPFGRHSVWRRRYLSRWRSVSRGRAARHRRPFRPSGCSVPGIIPLPLKKAFTPACNSHDFCYYYKLHWKKVCDLKFHQDTRSICKRRAKSFHVRLNCFIYAQEYLNAVRSGGKKHYG